MFRRSFQSIQAWSIVVTFSLLTVSTCFLVYKPKIAGDAYEYILAQQAFLNRLSFEFHEQDLESLKALLEREDYQIIENWYQSSLKPTLADSKETGAGYIKCKDGSYRSYHFWGYSFISAPLRLVSDFFKLNPLRTFTFLNSICVCLLIYSILKSSYFSKKESYLVLILILPILLCFYFDWVHPETVTASLLFLGILKFLEQKPTAFLLCGLASVQNQPIALALPILYLGFGVFAWCKHKQLGRVVFPFGRVFPYLLIAVTSLLVLLPSLYYTWVFGHANPIAYIGGVSVSNISFARYFSMWFDLNQGIILAFGGIILGICTVVALNFSSISIRHARTKMTDLFGMLIVILVIAVISIPCLVQGNWNAGCATILRYGLWIGLPLVFVYVQSLRLCGRASSHRFSIVFATLISFALIFSAGFPAKMNHLELNRLSLWVIHHFPELYNPIPEIIAERQQHQEEITYHKDWFAWGKDGIIRKALIRETSLIKEYIYSDGAHFRILNESPFNARKSIEGWTYFNGKLSSVSASYLEFRYDSPEIDWSLWSHAENGFRWSLGKETQLTFRIPDTSFTASGILLLEIEPRISDKNLTVLLNNHEIYHGQCPEKRTLCLWYEPKWLNASTPNILVFKTPGAGQSHAAIKDPRLLGLRLYSFKFAIYNHE